MTMVVPNDQHSHYCQMHSIQHMIRKLLQINAPQITPVKVVPSIILPQRFQCGHEFRKEGIPCFLSRFFVEIGDDLRHFFPGMTIDGNRLHARRACLTSLANWSRLRLASGSASISASRLMASSKPSSARGQPEKESSKLSTSDARSVSGSTRADWRSCFAPRVAIMSQVCLF